MSGDIFDGHEWCGGKAELLAPNGQEPGMLLHILPCTGQPPRGKKYLSQMSTVSMLGDCALVHQSTNFNVTHSNSC